MSYRFIQSSQNPMFKHLRKRTQDSRLLFKSNQAWLEGDHLCRAYLARGFQPQEVVYASDYKTDLRAWFDDASVQQVCLAPRLMQSLSTLDSAASVGFFIQLPAPTETLHACNSVVLDRVQDAGNVGAILRSAAAFGFTQILALQGTAQLWSAKVLRAGMGAHFALDLRQGLNVQSTVHALKMLSLPCLCTSSHTGCDLHRVRLPSPAAWFFGNEGQGLSPEVQAFADIHVRIAQPGGEESLNVAAAAAICLHTSANHS